MPITVTAILAEAEIASIGKLRYPRGDRGDVEAWVVA